MLKRSAGATAVVGAALLFLVFAAGAGAGNGGEAIGGDNIIQSYYTPLGMSTAPATVIVQVAGKPWAEVQGNAGRKLGKAERDQIKASLRATQAPIAAKVRDLGGKVENSFQSAYNGIRIEIARDKLPAIRALPNVVAIRTLQVFKPDNTNGVPLVGAPAVWDGVNGLHGEGIKVGIIDTGIDYTHANFDGPGTIADWNAAFATSTLAPNPLLVGPAAPRVKGGTDLVGDAYNANDPNSVPQPDSNPLDCNGHGSHVAGTAAGNGVLADGTTYHGPYTASTISDNSWGIGPGVAPKADIYAIRVFGCAGSTNVVVDAIDWAVDNDMNVINMSLGAPFGDASNPDAVASTNAASAGVIVVASAGNSGPGQYITGSPASATGAISVAANDPTPNFPGAHLTGVGAPMDLINANGASFSTFSGNLKVLVNDQATPGDESIGCQQSDYAGSAGMIVVVNRGVCARVSKAIRGQKAGAIAVIMANNSTSLPPFEGQITSDPDTGEQYTVTIPFLGARGPFTNAASDSGRLRAADGASVTISPTQIPNPTYLAFADFTSGGPRIGDSALKPDVTAPGVSIRSTGMGTGNGAAVLSGTSMAAPHTSGVAALTAQAHPGWTVEDLKAAMVNTADPALVANYSARLGGAGEIQAPGATRTNVDAVGDKATASLSFGFVDLRDNFSRSKSIKLRNHGGSAATFNVSETNASGSPHSVSFGSSQVTVPAGGAVSLGVTLNVPVATIGNADAFRDVAGLVKLTPTAGSNNGVALLVPYYLVPRADSNIDAKLASKSVPASAPSTTARVTNPGGAIAGTGDFYAWGLSDPTDTNASNDVRAIGVQAFPSGANRVIVFAINGYNRWSTGATNEFDIYVDVDPQNGNGDDYIVVGVDQGAVQTGSFNGVVGSFVFSMRSPGASIAFLAGAPTDGTTEELPFRSTQMCRAGEPCLSAANPRFTYHAFGFDIFTGGATDVVNGSAKFNPWTPAISQGDFLTVAPGGTATTPVTIDPAEWALTPALGSMVVSTDNKAGKGEAQLLGLSLG
jgi:minor extracellular serine protease Vpr